MVTVIKAVLLFMRCFLINEEIRDAISNNLSKDKLRTLVYKSDVTTLLQDGLEKVRLGKTSFEEMLKLIELDNDIADSASDEFNLSEALKVTKMAKEGAKG